MNGGLRFYEDLKERLTRQIQYASNGAIQETLQIRSHFIKLSSYKDTESTGKVKGIELLEALNITGKNVLLVEDMVDTGITMKAVLSKINAIYQPKSLKVCVAFYKKTLKNK